MKFKIEQLREKDTNELRSLFSTILKTSDTIILEGRFNLPSSHVARALAYLPRFVSKVLFQVTYSYEKVYYTVAVPNSNDGRTESTNKKSIGKALKNYITCLPQSIETVQFNFIDHEFSSYGQTTVCADLAEALEKLPAQVKTLNLHNALFYQDNGFLEYKAYESSFWHSFVDSFNAAKIFSNLSTKVNLKGLGVGNLAMGRLSPDKRAAILSSLNPRLTALSFVNNALYRLDAHSASHFFEQLPVKLVSLDLGFNGLNQKSPLELARFFSCIKRPTLKLLCLVGNQLSTFNPQELAQAFQGLPGTLSELDLGENELLLLDMDAFALLMEGLPKTLNSLRLCEKRVLPKTELEKRYRCIPSSIKTMGFSYSDLLGLSIVDFVEVLSYLPETVEGLDLSSNDFHEKSVDELIYLLANLPRYIRLLKLNDNGLVLFNLNALKAILSALSRQIRALDVTGNGLDRLPYTQMREVWRSLPPTVKNLIFENDKLTVRNDGALVSIASPIPVKVGFFKSQKRFSYHPEFAKLRILMMHTSMILFNRFPLEVIEKIFSYTFLNATTEEIKKYMQLSVNHFLISSVPPRQISPEHERQCLATVAQRINHLKSGDNCLDLSRCGLNRLESKFSQVHFISGLKTLSRAITKLKLRGNGFLQEKRCQQVFVELIKEIPENIKCLDLSDNGFEHENDKTLSELFKFIPTFIEQLILDNEQPMLPSEQIDKHCWPESYFSFLKATNNLQQARELLNDYTKDDSALRRFFYGHWNRHHTDAIARLVYYIDNDLISNVDDLNFELEQIKLSSQTGSLARRFSFLTSQQSKPAMSCLHNEAFEDTEAVELQIMN
ncbi:MAG: DUF5617 domain-containing protein [Sphingobacteriaceae bacterium]|nr:DUF5617 domain-containing protein [Sphingobacteriaceae bacterium]